MVSAIVLEYLAYDSYPDFRLPVPEYHGTESALPGTTEMGAPERSRFPRNYGVKCTVTCCTATSNWHWNSTTRTE